MADIVLGPAGGHGGHDFGVYAIPPGARVREIRINAGGYVDGLQLLFSDASGAAGELPHLGGRGGLHHTVTLEADEYLTGVSGRCGRYIDSIRFHTNRRTTDSYGGSGGEDEYRFEAASSGEIVGFTGRADWYIDQLGVLVRERASQITGMTAAPAGLAPAAGTVADAAAPPNSGRGRKKTATAATEPAVDTAPAAETATETATGTVPAKSGRGRKKTAPAAELVGLPGAAPVTPPAPDLVAIPDSTLAAPPAPGLIAMPDSAPVEATAPELIGIPNSAPIAVESAAQPAGERTATVDLGAKVAPDDLTKIEGIGPKIEGLLVAAGITTFAQLAATSVAELRGLLTAAGSRYRITDPTTWPDQAALAAAGDWAGFNELVGKLKAGRRG